MPSEDLIHQILSIPVESRTVEFKRLGSRNESVDRTLESIVAMANADGGALVFGVEDPQKTTLKGMDRIFGVEENMELFDEIGHAVKKISPPLANLWHPEFIPVKGLAKGREARIAILPIAKAVDGLRSIEGHVYVRQERSNKRLSPQEIVHFS